MTDRLTHLMSEEADRIDVPRAPADVVLSRGHQLRRRRRAGLVVAGLAALAVVGTGAATLTPSLDERDTVLEPAAVAPEQAGADASGAVFSIGTTLYLDDGATTTSIDDESVKSIYYTSAGILVRHGDNPYSDGGGPQRFTLVTPEGAAQPLNLATEGTVHATDPDQPYLAYAEDAGRERSIVVVDVRTETEVARVAVPQARADFAPVALDGDRVFLGDDSRTLMIDWRTGAVSVSGDLRGYPAVADGRAVVGFGADMSVIEVATGATLLTTSVGPEAYGYLTLSPTGRYAVLHREERSGTVRPDSIEVFDISTGASVMLAGPGDTWSWTTDDQLFGLDDDGLLTRCSAASGQCTSAQLDLTVLPGSESDPEDFSDDLVLGGQVRES